MNPLPAQLLLQPMPARSRTDENNTRWGYRIEEILYAARVHAETPQLVSITSDLKPVRVPPEHAVRTGLIVNELVTNALKYAFPGGHGNVHVTLTPTGTGGGPLSRLGFPPHADARQFQRRGVGVRRRPRHHGDPRRSRRWGANRRHRCERQLSLHFRTLAESLIWTESRTFRSPGAWRSASPQKFVTGSGRSERLIAGIAVETATIVD